MLIVSSKSFPGCQLDHEVSAVRIGLYQPSIGSEKGIERDITLNTAFMATINFRVSGVQLKIEGDFGAIPLVSLIIEYTKLYLLNSQENQAKDI